MGSYRAPLCLLICAATGLANAQSARDLLSAMGDPAKDGQAVETAGLLGVWALNCRELPSNDNGVLEYSTSPASAPLETYYYDVEFRTPSELRDVRTLPNHQLRWTASDPDSKKTLTIVTTLEPNRIRTWSSLDMAGNSYASDGKIVSSGMPTPWFYRCSRSDPAWPKASVAQKADNEAGAALADVVVPADSMALVRDLLILARRPWDIYDSTGQPSPQLLLDTAHITEILREQTRTKASLADFRYEAGEFVTEFKVRDPRLFKKRMASTVFFRLHPDSDRFDGLYTFCGSPSPDLPVYRLWPVSPATNMTIDPKLLPEECFFGGGKPRDRLPPRECAPLVNISRMMMALESDESARTDPHPPGYAPYAPVVEPMLAQINIACGSGHAAKRITADHWELIVPGGGKNVVQVHHCPNVDGRLRWSCSLVPSGAPATCGVSGSSEIEERLLPRYCHGATSPESPHHD